MAFHDSTVVILETGKDVVRAGLGLFDLLKTPTVVCPCHSPKNIADPHRKEIQARVGLRPSVSNGEHTNGTQNNSRAPSERPSRAPSQAPPPAGPNDYLVGSQLDEALAAGHDITVFWPFRENTITQWAQVEAIWCVCVSV